jgi:uncharacterized protein (TIGR00730 family)
MSDSRYSAIKAYKNEAFINSPEARPLRILSEYLEPEHRFEEFKIRDTIVVFGSARTLSKEVAEQRLAEAEASGGDVTDAKHKLRMSRYYEASRELSYRLTLWSKGLPEKGRRFVICSGGGPGVMEAANRGASEARGDNIGLNISLPFEQNDNPYITRKLSFEFHYFFMRKFWFSYLAKAFIVMPGGFGTMDEFFEVMTLVQTFKIKKKIALVLFGKEYWQSILNFQPMIDAGTISAEDIELFHYTDSIDDAYEYITAYLEQYVLEPERRGEVPDVGVPVSPEKPPLADPL